jgi:cell division protein ftsQ
LSRLEKFYRYGLSQAGWNKYSYIDIEFDNQIICKKRDEKAEKEEEDALLKKAQSEQVEDVQRTEEEERDKARKEVKRQEDASAGLTE